MPGPVSDLRGREASRGAVDEKYADLLTTHTSTNSSAGARSEHLLFKRPEKAADSTDRRRAYARCCPRRTAVCSPARSSNAMRAASTWLLCSSVVRHGSVT